MILIEAAVDSLGGALAAVKEGAGRLELCADLPRGGVTPSAGLIRAVRARVDEPLFVMIRPRSGDFVYHSAELEVMLLDIAEARRAGVDGVVFGALTPDQAVDVAAVTSLVAAAGALSVTFHRAIDLTADPAAAAALLGSLGVDRVLSAGGAESAEAGLDLLAKMAERGGTPRILPGGGIRAGNVERIVHRLAATEVHVGAPDGAEPGRIAAVAEALAGM